MDFFLSQREGTFENRVKGTGLHGKQIKNRQSASDAEVLYARQAAMPTLRAAAGRVSQVWDLPDLFPQPGG